MKTMVLAPPSQTNPHGALWGMTRNEGTKFHSGIDITATVGTPIYAAHSGTVGKVINYQPNRVNGKYPANYTGKDRDGGGNRIYINTGGGRQDAYFHLQAGKPIATNPRTSKPFKFGDTINMGEIIGYAGISGNASPKVPHLHFGTKENGEWVDPFSSINATLNSNLSISTPCD